MRRRSADRSRGFTLIEVLAALVIVSLGMLAVIQAVSETARNGNYLRDRTMAHWIAMNQLTLTRLAPSAPKIDKSEDEVEMGGRRWRWTMEVTQTPLDSVRRIDVSVRPEDSDKDSSLASVTGFYGTAIGQPGTALVMWQQSTAEQQARGGGDRQDDDDKKDDGKDGEPPPRDNPRPDPGGEPVDPPPAEPTPEPTE